MSTILLVDDISFVRKVEKNTLEKEGHQIIGDAKDGEEAIELYKKLKPDLVIMDITMPKVNGIEALDKILQVDPAARVIMCSALAHERVLYQAIKLGAKDYLVKPYTKEQLIKAVERATKTKS